MLPENTGLGNPKIITGTAYETIGENTIHNVRIFT
jgi:hypothetical protein